MYLNARHTHKEDIANAVSESVKDWRTQESLLTLVCKLFEPTGNHGSKGNGGVLALLLIGYRNEYIRRKLKVIRTVLCRTEWSFTECEPGDCVVQSRPLSPSQADGDR